MESLAIFEQTCQTKWFANASIILFLNKCDIFKEKIAKRDLRCCFPDYNDGCDYDAGIRYIQNQFLLLNTVRSPSFYSNVSILITF